MVILFVILLLEFWLGVWIFIMGGKIFIVLDLLCFCNSKKVFFVDVLVVEMVYDFVRVFMFCIFKFLINGVFIKDVNVMFLGELYCFIWRVWILFSRFFK